MHLQAQVRLWHQPDLLRCPLDGRYHLVHDVNDILLCPDANGALMITISRLEEASDAAVKDINLLLPQVRSDSSQHKGSLSDLQNIVENDWTSMIVAKDAERIVGMATVHIANNMGSASVISKATRENP